jgi:hypothetical protein
MECTSDFDCIVCRKYTGTQLESLPTIDWACTAAETIDVDEAECSGLGGLAAHQKGRFSQSAVESVASGRSSSHPGWLRGMGMVPVDPQG